MEFFIVIELKCLDKSFSFLPIVNKKHFHKKHLLFLSVKFFGYDGKYVSKLLIRRHE